MSDAAGPVIELVPVTADNRDAVLQLQVAASQRNFLASNRESLREARYDRDARPRAVVAGGDVVGFLMYEAPEDEDIATIYRFMIDRSAQGRGFGNAALQAALAEIRALGHVRAISVCYMPENKSAQRLYSAAGFVEEGLDEDGEMIARLNVAKGG
jgi:diamine N-acetyltransferase